MFLFSFYIIAWVSSKDAYALKRQYSLHIVVIYSYLNCFEQREDDAMKDYQYTIILHPDAEQGGYTVTVPCLPGCVTEGDTLEEAIAMAKEAIQLYIESLIADGEPVPEEKEHVQAIVISIAA